MPMGPVGGGASWPRDASAAPPVRGSSLGSHASYSVAMYTVLLAAVLYVTQPMLAHKLLLLALSVLLLRLAIQSTQAKRALVNLCNHALAYATANVLEFKELNIGRCDDAGNQHTFTFTEVNVTHALLHKLSLPVAIQRLHIAAVHVAIRRWRLYVKLEQVTAKLCHAVAPPPISRALHNARVQRKARLVHTSQLHAVESLLWDTDVSTIAARAAEAVTNAAIFCAVSLFDVEVTDFSVKLISRGACKGDDAVAPYVRLSVGEVGVRHALRGEQQERLAAVNLKAHVKGLKLFVGTPGIKEQPVVHRWGASVNVVWRGAALRRPRLMKRGTCSSRDSAVLDVHAEATALIVHATPLSCRVLAEQAAGIALVNRHWRFRRLRPVDDVAASPEAWWRHAIHCVLDERRALFRNRTEVPLADLAERRRKRIEHAGLYSSVLSTGQGIAELAQLEDSLGIETAALFRWWHWAEHGVGRGVKLAKFSSVQKIINAAGHLASGRKRKVAMYMSAECPKISAVFHFSEKDTLEVSAIDVGVTVVIGRKDEDEDVVSGAGALDAEVISRGLFVTPRSDESLPDAWLVQCPPQGERPWVPRVAEEPPAPESPSEKGKDSPSSSVASSLRRESVDTANGKEEASRHFFTLRYKVPPFQSCRSTQLSLETDAMDVLFSHAWFSKIVSFATPSLAIAQLARRNTVDTVGEDILSATRRSESRERKRFSKSARLMLARARLTNTVVRTQLGEVCLILPCRPAEAERGVGAASNTYSYASRTSTAQVSKSPSLVMVLGNTILLSSYNLNNVDGDDERFTQDREDNAHDVGTRFSQNLSIVTDVSLWSIGDKGRCEAVLERTPLSLTLCQYNEAVFNEDSGPTIYQVSLAKLNIRSLIALTLSPQAVRNMSALVQSLKGLVTTSKLQHLSRSEVEAYKVVRRSFKKVISLRCSLPRLRFSLRSEDASMAAIATLELRRAMASLVSRDAGWELSYSVESIVVHQGEMRPLTDERSRMLHRYDSGISDATSADSVDLDSLQSSFAESSEADGVTSFGKWSPRSICPQLPMRLLKRAYPSPRSRLFCSFKVWRRVLLTKKVRSRKGQAWLRKMLDDSNPQFGGLVNFQSDINELTVVNHISILSLSLSIDVLQDLLRTFGKFRVAIAASSAESLVSPRDEGARLSFDDSPPMQTSAGNTGLRRKKVRTRVQLHMACARLFVWMNERPFLSSVVEDMRFERETYPNSSNSGDVASHVTGSLESIAVLYLLSTSEPVEILEPYRHIITCDTNDDFPAIRFAHHTYVPASEASEDCAPKKDTTHGVNCGQDVHEIRNDVALETDMEIHDVIRSRSRVTDTPEDRLRRMSRLKEISPRSPETVVTLNAVQVFVLLRFIKDVRFFANSLLDTMKELSAEEASVHALFETPKKASDGLGESSDASRTHEPVKNPVDVGEPKFRIRAIRVQVDMPLNSLSTEKYRLVANQAIMHLPAPCAFYERACEKSSARRTTSSSSLRVRIPEMGPFIRSATCAHDLSVNDGSASHDQAGTCDMFADLPQMDDAVLFGHQYKQSDDDRTETTLKSSQKPFDIVAELQSWSIYWMMLDPSSETQERSQVRKVIDPGDAVVGMYFSPNFRLLTDFPYLSAVFGEIQYNLLMGLIYDNSCEPCTFKDPPRATPRPGFPLPVPPLAPKVLGLESSAMPWWEIVARVPDALIAVEKGSVGNVMHDNGVGLPLGLVDLKELVVIVGGAYECRSIRIRVFSRGVKISDTRLAESHGVMRGIIDALNSSYVADEKVSRFPTSPAVTNNWEPFFSDERAFMLDYVIQAIDGESGPHVIEIKLEETTLCWPYETDFEFILDISEVFSNYTYRPFCSPYPDLPPAYFERIPWFYVNVVIERSDLHVPLPLTCPASWRDSLIAKTKDEVVLAWNTLRVGYFWGGDGHVELVVGARDLKVDCVYEASHGKSMRAEVLRPLHADVTLQTHVPKSDQNSAKMVDASVRIGHLYIDLSHNTLSTMLKAVHVIKRAVTPASHTGDGEELEDGVEKINSPTAVDENTSPSRKSVTNVKFNAQGVHVTLINDDYERKADTKNSLRFARSFNSPIKATIHSNDYGSLRTPSQKIGEHGFRLDIFRAYLHDIELALVQETFGSIPATRAQRADSVNLQPMVNEDGSTLRDPVRSDSNDSLPGASSGESSTLSRGTGTASEDVREAPDMQIQLSVRARLGADCLDSSNDMMDVTVEEWPVEAEFVKLGSSANVNVLSKQRMKASFGPSQIEAYKDIQAFLRQWREKSDELERLVEDTSSQYYLPAMITSEKTLKEPKLERRVTRVPDSYALLNDEITRQRRHGSTSAASEHTMLYRIRNKTGIRLFFSPYTTPEDIPTSESLDMKHSSIGELRKAQSSSSNSGAQQTLDPNVEKPLKHRVISIAFDHPDWAPLHGVQVDKVGRCAAWIHYANSEYSHRGALTNSPISNRLFPVLFEVELNGRQKVLTVTSRVRLDYALPLGVTELSPDVNLIMRLPGDVGHGQASGNTTKSLLNTRRQSSMIAEPYDGEAARVKWGRRGSISSGGVNTLTLGPFEPGDVCPMPLGIKKGCRLYVHADGYKMAEKDVIDLNPRKLTSQEGIISCPAILSHVDDLNFFLRVKKESVPEHTSGAVGSMENDLDDGPVVDIYQLELCPPMALMNLLPVPVSITLHSGDISQNYFLEAGQSAESHEFNMEKAINLKLKLGSWQSTKDVEVYHPINRDSRGMTYGFARKTRTLLSDLPGLRVSSEVRLKDASGTNRSSNLRVRFETRSAENTDSCPPFRTLSLWAPYWIINNTCANLHVRDAFGSARAFLPSYNARAASPGLDRQDSGEVAEEHSPPSLDRGRYTPTIYSGSSYAGYNKLSVDGKTWSRRVSFDSVGLRVRVAVKSAVSVAKAFSQRLSGRSDGQSVNETPRSSRLLSDGRKRRSGQISNVATIQGGAGKRNWRRKQRHDFGVQIIHAPEPFNLTKVIIVSNRIVLRNSSSIELEVRQRGADVGFNHRLPLDSVLPYHWDDARKPMELQMRPLDDAVGTWKWSGRIRLDKEGRYGMRIMSSEEGETYRSRTPQQLILIVDVSLMETTLMVTILNGSTCPPYKIVNDSSVRLVYWQREAAVQDFRRAFMRAAGRGGPLPSDTEAESATDSAEHFTNIRAYDSVAPGESRDYAWDEPSVGTKKLRVVADGSLGPRDFVLDNITFDQTQCIVVHTSTHTSDSTRSVEPTQEAGGGESPTETPTYQRLKSVFFAANNRNDASSSRKLIYMTITAEGSTRVVRFSDTHESRLETEKEKEEKLAKTIARVEGQLQIVDDELRSLLQDNMIGTASVPSPRPIGATRSNAGDKVDKTESRNQFTFTPQVWKRSISYKGTDSADSEESDDDSPEQGANKTPSFRAAQLAKSHSRKNRRFGIALFNPKKSMKASKSMPLETKEQQLVPETAATPTRSRFGRASSYNERRSATMRAATLSARDDSQTSAGATEPIDEDEMTSKATTEDDTNASVAGAVEGGELIVFLDRGEDVVPKERSARCDTYAILTILSSDEDAHDDNKQQGVERTMRTPVIRRSASPTFKREMMFTSVHSDDVLVVSLYAKDRRIGPFTNDEFLGEVDIFLNDVDTRPDKVVLPVKYQLSRRTAKDRVQGSVYVALSWNVNPVEQNKIILRLKRRALEEKRERIAQLTDDRCDHAIRNPFLIDERRNELVLNTSFVNRTDNSSNHAGLNGGVWDHNLTKRRNGQVLVRVIAARGLIGPSHQPDGILSRAILGINKMGSTLVSNFAHMPSGTRRAASSLPGASEVNPSVTPDAPHEARGSVDARADASTAAVECYVRLGIKGREETQATGVVQGFQGDPVWNEDKVLHKVDPNGTLEIAVYVPRKVGKDHLLGESRIRLRELTSGQPIYAWIPIFEDVRSGGGSPLTGSSQRRADSWPARHSNDRRRMRKVGELRIRLQWITNADVALGGGDVDVPNAMVAQVRFAGFGISLFERQQLGTQREWMHILLEDMALIARQENSPLGEHKTKKQLFFALGSAQIDNQLVSAQEPVVVARHDLSSYDISRDKNRRSTTGMSVSHLHDDSLYGYKGFGENDHEYLDAYVDDATLLRSPSTFAHTCSFDPICHGMESNAFTRIHEKYLESQEALTPGVIDDRAGTSASESTSQSAHSRGEHSKPLLYCEVQMLSNSHFERLLVDCLPIDVQLDEEFLLTAVEFGRTVANELGGPSGIAAANAAAVAAATEPSLVLSDFFRNSHLDITSLDRKESREAAARGAGWLYFRDFCVRELQVHLTLTRSPRAESKRRHLSTVMGLNLVDVNAVPLRLAEIHYADLFEMTSDLQRRLLTTVKSTILFEFYKILGTVDILGTPVALISSVGTGVVDFFANPARGIMSSPEDFARGMASGTVSLLRNSMYGVFNTAAKVTGSMSKGLAALSMDDDFIMHLKAPNRTSADASVFRGVQDLGFGLIQGVTGLVYDPIRGAEREGLKGFVKGLISGIAGVAMKPAAGVFEFAAKTASSVGGGIQALGDDIGRRDQHRKRIAPPRASGYSNRSGMTGASADAIVAAWKPELAFRIGAGKFAGDTPLEYVATGQARGVNGVLFTDKRIIVLSIHRRVIWTSEYKNTQLVSSNERTLTTNLLCNVKVGKMHLRVPDLRMCACVGVVRAGDSSRTILLGGVRVPWHRQIRCNARDAHRLLHAAAAQMIARFGGRVSDKQGDSDNLLDNGKVRKLMSFKQDFTLLPQVESADKPGTSENSAEEESDVIGADAGADAVKTEEDLEQGNASILSGDAEKSRHRSVRLGGEAKSVRRRLDVAAAAIADEEEKEGEAVAIMAADLEDANTSDNADPQALASVFDAAAHMCERGLRAGAPADMAHYVSAVLTMCAAAAEAASASAATDLTRLGHAIGFLMKGYQDGKVFPEQVLRGLQAVLLEARDACVRLVDDSKMNEEEVSKLAEANIYE